MFSEKRIGIAACLLGLGLFGAIFFEQVKKWDGEEIAYQLVDPEMSPNPLREKVMLGFRIMDETKKYAPLYAGAALSCNSCHFNGGNSYGGKNTGIPLVGVSNKYPHYSARDEKVIDLSERIQNCFERSLNGSPPPPSSGEMEAVIAYLDWISSPVITEKNLPWLGLKPVFTTYIANFPEGRVLYNEKCASCHGKEGEGSKERPGDSVPPLWGDNSFNDGAGMNRPEMFAAFTFDNMPKGQPTLTKEQAEDIAAFVTRQPRPHFNHYKEKQK